MMHGSNSCGYFHILITLSCFLSVSAEYDSVTNNSKGYSGEFRNYSWNVEAPRQLSLLILGEFKRIN